VADNDNGNADESDDCGDFDQLSPQERVKCLREKQVRELALAAIYPRTRRSSYYPVSFGVDVEDRPKDKPNESSGSPEALTWDI
jgi:hypothetical protein